MPTDNVKNRTFRELFKNNTRFEIPFFQRGYAWGKKQWEQLFTDLDEEILNELESGKSLQDVEHFFGPIVVQEKSGMSDELREYLVIDGQQRITTIYLLLGVINDALRAKTHQSHDAVSHCGELRRYLSNDVEHKDDYLKLKVFSTKGDRLPTYRVIFGDDFNPTSAYFQADNQLYRPGSNQIDEFRSYASKRVKSLCPDVPRLWQLAQVLLNCLKIVWIPLDAHKDDAQAIFESLNDKGMPLSSSELLCNYLFRPLSSSEDFEQIHNEQWLSAVKLMQDRDRFEEYLRNLFSIGERKMVGKGRKVYVHFKNRNRALNSAMARKVIGEINDSARLYRNIIQPLDYRYGHAGIHRLLIDISHTRMDSSTPFVLSVLQKHQRNDLSDAEAEKLLRETLVLLVRRKMTEQPTTIYDTMFPQLMAKIYDEPSRVKALHDQFRKNGVWVTDSEFEEALVNRPLYRSKDLPFARMVLAEVDRRLQSFHQLPDYSTVQSIEHTIPQTLDDEWREYLGSEAQDERLDMLKHTIGNLCLLSGPANSSVGQNAFERKKNAYSQVTALARQIKNYEGAWNMDAVRSRSKALAQVAVDAWSWAEPCSL